MLVALVCVALGLLAAELGKDSADRGVKIANPCKRRTAFPGHGIDATIQRVVLDGLDGAACRLHTSREELVLSLRASSGKRRWDRRTIDTALRAGLLRAVDEADRRGDIPGFLAPLVRRVVRTLPLDKLVEGGIRLRDLLG
ncbi:MAG TPA: hypothetical protein VE736_11320 [Gaiellaceae bacterium]|nr:hypothetical protein [Gaiellaceae bacterium]